MFLYREKKSKHPLYLRFRGMQDRCNLLSNKGYKDYGARGIKCLWKTFDDFVEDMYESYLEHVKEFGDGLYTSIERINNDGNYCRENCRWATPTEQLLNQRDIRHRENGRFAKRPE